MKRIKTEDAVGHVLCHDITRIIPGVTKDAVFRKGHVVRGEDIPVLLKIGKEELYIWENEAGMLHENDGAEILCKITRGKHLERSAVKEGKIDLIAAVDGLLKINREKLRAINRLGQMVIATRQGDLPVCQGDKVAGMRVIPLVIEEERMKRAEALAGAEPILQIRPFQHKKVGIVTTGNEVYKGRIEDQFTPVLRAKLKEYDTEVIGHVILPDDHERITQAILDLLAAGADLILCSGGMSVDPDDRTPLAIKNTGADIVTYGAPVLPGAMCLLAYFEGEIPIVGLPGCVMYSKRTVFDLLLPRIMADDKIKAEEIADMGEGGLCLLCPECTFPACRFGG